MNRSERRALAARQNKLTGQLREVPREDWPKPSGNNEPRPISVFLSRDFLVQVFSDDADKSNSPPGTIRISVNRTVMCSDGHWQDGITWDDLQRIKRAIGFADRVAVEIYPADNDVVNVANMRHLWILQEPLQIGWRRT